MSLQGIRGVQSAVPAGKTSVRLFEYSADEFREETLEQLDGRLPRRDATTVTWVDISGLDDVALVEAIGDYYDLHPLTVEDILNPAQRPKLDDVETYLYIALKMLYRDPVHDAIDAEHVSIVLGTNFVLSFQEAGGDVFDHIRQRIRNGMGRMRRLGADFLAYAIIDAIADNYFVVLEKVGDDTESLEEALITNPTRDALDQIHGLRQQLIFMRKAVWPLREVINMLESGETPLIHESTGFYLRDVYDHVIQAADIIETSQDILASNLDIYLSSVSNRLNEVMRLLTVITTVFMPLTFIAGVYGMNFHFMPELSSPYGYPAVLLVMLLIAGGMLRYFHRRGWI